MSTVPVQRSPEEFRLHVALTALRLFLNQGFEATTVDHIAAVAGVSRRTLFRQFGSKDDIVFADHESLLAELEKFLSAANPAQPWLAVCDSAVLVLESFAQTPELSIQRYQIQRSVPALRDREIITSHRYERLFVDYLRQVEPGGDPIISVSFAAAVIATHNYLLRQALRRGQVPEPAELVSALARVRDGFRPHRDRESPQNHAGKVAPTLLEAGVVVATYPAGVTTEQLLVGIKSQLEQQKRTFTGTE